MNGTPVATGRMLALAVMGGILGACTGSGPTISDHAVESLDGTTLLFEWTTSEAVRGELAYGADGVLDQVVEVSPEPTTHHEYLLVGLPPLTDCSYEYRAVEDGETIDVFAGSVTTAQEPSELPDLEVTTARSGAWTEGYLVGTVMGQVESPVILSTEGHYVWWRIEEGEGRLCSQARLSHDGTAVLYVLYAQHSDETGTEDSSELIRHPLDGSEEQRYGTPGIHHDFVELPDGTIAYLVSEIRREEGTTYIADEIVEMAPDGSQTVVWSAWDRLAEEVDDYVFDQGYGWTHANAIHYDESADAYHVSFRALDAIFEIDRASGERVWALGGAASDFEIEGRSFSYQHHFEFNGDDLLVFDNNSDDGASRLLEYRLDLAEMTAEEIWSYESDPPLYVETFGNAHRLPSGHTVAIWGQAAQYDEVSPEGDLLLRIETDLGAGWGYYNWLGDLSELTGVSGG